MQEDLEEHQQDFTTVENKHDQVLNMNEHYTLYIG